MIGSYDVFPTLTFRKAKSEQFLKDLEWKRREGCWRREREKPNARSKTKARYSMSALLRFARQISHVKVSRRRRWNTIRARVRTQFQVSRGEREGERERAKQVGSGRHRRGKHTFALHSFKALQEVSFVCLSCSCSSCSCSCSSFSPLPLPSYSQLARCRF